MVINCHIIYLQARVFSSRATKTANCNQCYQRNSECSGSMIFLRRERCLLESVVAKTLGFQRVFNKMNRHIPWISPTWETLKNRWTWECAAIQFIANFTTTMNSLPRLWDMNDIPGKSTTESTTQLRHRKFLHLSTVMARLWVPCPLFEGGRAPRRCSNTPIFPPLLNRIQHMQMTTHIENKHQSSMYDACKSKMFQT